MVHRGDLGETVSAFVADHYEARRPPRLLLTPVPLLDGVEAWLEERRGAKVDCRVPMRGIWPRFAAWPTKTRRSSGTTGTSGSGSLSNALQTTVPSCLDWTVWTTSSVSTWRNCKVRSGWGECRARNGRPAKKEYRTYTVKGDAMDDLRMMQEVVQRWLKRQDEWPDLLLLTAGKRTLTPSSGPWRKRRCGAALRWLRWQNARKPCFARGTTPSSSTETDACWSMRETKRTASSTASIATSWTKHDGGPAGIR